MFLSIGGIGGVDCVVWIILIWDVLVRRIAKHLHPFRCIEIWESSKIRGDRREPVIEHDMELGSDGACASIKYNGNCGGMFRGKPHQNHSL